MMRGMHHLCVAGLFLGLGCDPSVDLKTLRLKLWEPVGMDYFTDDATLSVSLETADGQIAQQSQAAKDFTLELGGLELNNSEVKVDLTLTKLGIDHVGSTDWFALLWPGADDSNFEQREVSVFAGPKNELATLTLSPTDAQATFCVDERRQLFFGSALGGDWESYGLEFKYLNQDTRNVSNGPIFPATPANAKCAIDAQQTVWVYGGCDSNASPVGTLQKSPAREDAEVQVFELERQRNSCFVDLLVEDENLWILDGGLVEVRSRNGEILASWEKSRADVAGRLLHAQNLPGHVWLSERSADRSGTVYLLKYEDGEIREEKSIFNDRTTECTNARSGAIVCITTEGLERVNDSLDAALLVDGAVLFADDFAPIRLTEGRRELWVTVNQGGDQLRIANTETSKTVTAEKSRPDSVLITGPGGAVFWGGGGSGLHLLSTEPW